MSSLDTTFGNASFGFINEDSVSSITRVGSTKKHHQQHFPAQTNHRIVEDNRDKTSFYKDLFHFHEIKG